MVELELKILSPRSPGTQERKGLGREGQVQSSGAKAPENLRGAPGRLEFPVRTVRIVFHDEADRKQRGALGGPGMPRVGIRLYGSHPES